jgi:aquaporin Z
LGTFGLVFVGAAVVVVNGGFPNSGIAAVLAAYLVKALFPVGAVRNALVGVPVIAGSISLTQAIGLELILTFFLMSAVYGTAVSADAPRVGGFGIGLVLLFDILVGGPLTGAAMNPARAFGPAVVSGEWVGHIAYWVGPIAGALLAALLWEYFLLPKGPHRRRKTD